MSKIILVTGGARSGKSNFAESLCINQNNRTAYIATSVAFDEEMKNRVKKHQESRPKEWKTYEIYKDIYSIVETLDKNHDTVIMDCVTLMVNNLWNHNSHLRLQSTVKDALTQPEIALHHSLLSPPDA